LLVASQFGLARASLAIGVQLGKDDGGVTIGAGRLVLLQKSSGNQKHTNPLRGGLIRWMPTTNKSHLNADTKTNVLIYKRF
jgi:hypothetical protein